MKYYQIKPSKRLSPYVKYFWVGEAEASEEKHFTHYFVATSCSKIVFHYKGQFEKIAGGVLSKSFSSGMQGQSTINAQYRACENTGIFGIEFSPYAIPFLFSIPATELTNRFVDLKTFLGSKGQELEERIFLARTDQERVMLATQFLESSIKMPGNLYVIEAISRINSSKGLINMNTFVKDLPVSQRQFERSFKEIAGFTPKTYARILRFESALGKFKDANSFTEIALDSGYFDQAHFIHDFTEFTGLQPKSYFKAIADLPFSTY
jgi:AraC-like DNA-binding protein